MTQDELELSDYSVGMRSSSIAYKAYNFCRYLRTCTAQAGLFVITCERKYGLPTICNNISLIHGFLFIAKHYADLARH